MSPTWTRLMARTGVGGSKARDGSRNRSCGINACIGLGTVISAPGSSGLVHGMDGYGGNHRAMLMILGRCLILLATLLISASASLPNSVLGFVLSQSAVALLAVTLLRPSRLWRSIISIRIGHGILHWTPGSTRKRMG